MKLNYILILLILISTSAIAQNFTTKKAGNCYTLDIPNYMVKKYDLNDAASLQYKNAVKEAYIIVIEDSKDELNSLSMVFQNPKEFLENFTNGYQLESENRTISETQEFVNNNNEHAQVEMSWSSEDGQFYMLITTVETEKNFYKILCWTLLEYKNNLRDDYLTISKSLVD